jgi:hypothetical protein
MNNTIQSLWVGDRLSEIEIICINSFLYHQYEYVLYSYSNIENLPKGVVSKNANEILELSDLLNNQQLFDQKKSSSFLYSPFSDLFRYRLLYLNGGWWHDTDSCCLSRFDFNEEYIVGKHSVKHNNNILSYVASGVIKAPKNSLFFKKCFDLAYSHCQNKNWNISWSEIGPLFLAHMLREENIPVKIFDSKVFYPFPYWYSKERIRSPLPINLNESKCLHFYTSTWTDEEKNTIAKNSNMNMLHKKYVTSKENSSFSVDKPIKHDRIEESKREDQSRD